MKNLILAVALVAVVVACKTDKKSVADPAGANVPKAECCPTKADCTDAKKAECMEAKKKAGGAASHCGSKAQG